MNKKVLAIMLAAMMSLSALAGCGTNDSTTSEATPDTTITDDAGTPTDDGAATPDDGAATPDDGAATPDDGAVSTDTAAE